MSKCRKFSKHQAVQPEAGKPKGTFDEGKARFLFEQANERLKYSVESIDTVKEKSYIVFGVFITILTGLVAFLMGIVDFKIGCELHNLPIFFATVYLITRYFQIACHLRKNLSTISVNTPGKEFTLLFKEVKKDISLPLLMAAESKDIDRRIKKNRAVNILLSRRLNYALKESLMSTAIAFFCYVLLGCAVSFVIGEKL